MQDTGHRGQHGHDHLQQGLLGGVIPPRRVHDNSHFTSLDLAAHVFSSAVLATENEPFGEQTGTGRMKQSLRFRRVASERSALNKNGIKLKAPPLGIGFLRTATLEKGATSKDASCYQKSAASSAERRG